MKIVVFTGKKRPRFPGSTDPDDCLNYGWPYEVVSELVVVSGCDPKWQTTLYQLRGVKGVVDGIFDSKWFENVENMDVVVSDTIPEIDKRFKCQKIVSLGKHTNQYAFKYLLTTIVIAVLPFPGNIYFVTTQDNSYIVKVLK